MSSSILLSILDQFLPSKKKQIHNRRSTFCTMPAFWSATGELPPTDGIVDLGEDLTLETGDSTSIRDEGIEEIGWKDFEARLP
jgi:hypothetical protein